MGLEYTPLRWQISQGLVENCNVDNGILVNVDGTQMGTFAPATLFYSFNVGVPLAVLSCMMETISNTPTLCWVLVFTPLDLPGWKHVQTYSNWPMAGSGEIPSGYLYIRDGANSKSRRTSWKMLARMAAPEFQAGLNMADVPGELKKAAIAASQEFQKGAPPPDVDLTALAGKMLASEATYAAAAAANCNVAAAAEETYIFFAQRATADDLPLASGEWQAE
jgi:hypothetical protein